MYYKQQRTTQYDIGPLWHGSDRISPDVWSLNECPDPGVYFTADQRYAAFYGTKAIVQAFISLRNPYLISMPDEWKYEGTVTNGNQIIAASYRHLTNGQIKQLESIGYDGIIVRVKGPLPAGGAWKKNPKNPFEVVIFNPRNITALSFLNTDHCYEH